MKNKALYGLVSGVALVVATLIGIALLNTPSVGRTVTSPADGSMAVCQHGTSPQGYGVVRQGRECTAADRSPTPTPGGTGRP